MQKELMQKEQAISHPFLTRFWLIKPVAFLIIINSLITLLAGCGTTRTFDAGKRYLDKQAKVIGYEWESKAIGPYRLVRPVKVLHIPEEQIHKVRHYKTRTEYTAGDYLRMATDAMILPALIRWLQCDDHGRIFGKKSKDCQPYGTTVNQHHDTYQYTPTGHYKVQRAPLKNVQVIWQSQEDETRLRANSHGWIILDTRQHPGRKAKLTLSHSSTHTLDEFPIEYPNHQAQYAHEEYEWSTTMHALLPQLIEQINHAHPEKESNVSDYFQQLQTLRLKEFRKIPDALKQERKRLIHDQPKPKTLTQGEFETTTQFNRRKEQEVQAYQHALAQWNGRTKQFNQRKQTFDKHHQQLPKDEIRLLKDIAINKVLGEPRIQDVRYIADASAFFITIENPDYAMNAWSFLLPIQGTIQEAMQLKQRLLAHPEVMIKMIERDNNIRIGQQISITIKQEEQHTLTLTGQRTDISPESTNLVLAGKVLEIPDLDIKALKTIDQPHWTASISTENDQPLLPLLAQLPTDIVPASDNRYALLIGNKNYQPLRGGPNAAEYAHNDLTVIHALLTKSLGYPEENVIVIKDATKAEMEYRLGSAHGPSRYLKQLIHTSKQAELFIYYSGHGTLSDANGAPVLLAADSKIGDTEATGYKVKQLYNNLSKLPLANTNVVIEACFNGKDSQERPLIWGVSGLVPTQPEASLPFTGTLITASGKNETAKWHPNKQLGLFTHRLVQGIIDQPELGLAFHLPTKSQPQPFPLKRLGHYLKTQVPRDVRKLKPHLSQNPTISSTLF
jgi:flagellar motor protein MotB